MKPETTAVALDSLLAEEAWARRLARALVGDADADDLVQEALLQVTRGRVRAPASPRAWFATVLRNGAANLARERGRRRDREQRVARRERLDETPQLLVAQLEQRRVLAELLLECPAELRTPLMLHHEQSLGWAAIARQLGTGETTAKARAERGLAWMRARIEDSDGDGRGLAGLGVLLVEPRALMVAPAAAAAGFALFWKAATAAAVVALALGLGWWLSSPADPAGPPSGEVADRPLELSSDDEQQIARVPQPPRDVERAGAAATSDPKEAELEESEDAGSEGMLVLLAQLVGPDGRPVAGAEFRTSSATIRSDAHGRVEITTALPNSPERQLWEAETADRRFATGHLRSSARGTYDLGTLQLAESGLVRGRVIMADGSVPTGSVGIALQPTEVAPVGMVHRWQDLDAGGHFELRSFHFQPVTLLAFAGSKNPHSGPTIQPIAGQVVVMDEFIVEVDDRPRSLEMSFSDPSGAPIDIGRAAFILGDWRQISKSIGTSHYSLSISNSTAAEVRVEALDLSGRFGVRHESSLDSALPELRLTLQPLELLQVRVQDSAGAPVADAQLQVHTIDAAGMHDRLNALAKTEPTTAEVHELHLFDTAFNLAVHAPGFEPLRLGPFQTVPAEVLGARLTRLPSLAGQVLSGGQPVAGARLQLHTIYPGIQELVERIPVEYSCDVLEEATADAEGRFALTVPAAVPFALVASAPGLGEQWLRVDDASAPISLELRPTGRIAGRIVLGPDALHERLAGRHVAIARGGLDLRSAEVDAEGRFEFDVVAPGDWTVAPIDVPLPTPIFSRSWSQQSKDRLESAELVPNLTVRSGETSEIELQIRAPTSLQIHGQVLLDGADFQTWSIRSDGPPHWPTDQRLETGSASLDEHGRFTVEVPGNSAFQLELNGVSGDLRLTISRSFEPRTGAELQLAPLEILTGELDALSGPSGTRLWLQGELSAGWAWGSWADLAGDALLLEGVPAGELRYGSGYETSRAELSRLSLTPGATASAQAP